MQTTTLTQGDKQKNTTTQNPSSPPSPTSGHSLNDNNTQLRSSQTNAEKNVTPSQPAANQENPHDKIHGVKDPEDVALPTDSESEAEDFKRTSLISKMLA